MLNDDEPLGIRRNWKISHQQETGAVWRDVEVSIDPFEAEGFRVEKRAGTAHVKDRLQLKRNTREATIDVEVKQFAPTRQRSSSLRSAGDVDAGSACHSGSRSMTAAIVSETVARAKAPRPVSISKSTQPKAQMSVRLSGDCPRACSGLMYAAVPMMMPGCVAVASAVGASVKPESLSAGWSFASPKSEHLQEARGRDLDVRRLQVTMNDALFVRGIERIDNLTRDAEHVRHRQARGPSCQSIGEGLTLNQLHGFRSRAR
jgi:hypothetical protein